MDNAGQWSSNDHYFRSHDTVGSQKNAAENSDFSAEGPLKDNAEDDRNFYSKPPKAQKGVLRTNCIDCLDRTNVAQFAYGLTALGHQLYALGFIDVPKIDLDSPLADELMCFYERMGDTLALQYGGSAAHNKVLYIILLLYHVMNTLIISYSIGSLCKCIPYVFSFNVQAWKGTLLLFFNSSLKVIFGKRTMNCNDILFR